MNKTKLPSMISVLILTLITVVMWVSLDIYRAIKKTTQITVPAEISQPFTPTLDQNSIQLIESRNFLDDSQILDNIVNSPPSPASTTTPSPTINASDSGTTQ